MNKPDEESFSDRRSYWTMRSVEWFGKHLPRAAGLAAGEAFMRLSYERNDRQRSTVARNLSRVLGHPPDSSLVRRATQECFRLYGRYWYETFALRSMPVEEVNRRFTIDGLEHIDGGVRAGRGIIMALPHMGNWDAAGHWLCVNGYRMTAVAEELKPQGVYELFLRHRRALGMGIVPLASQAKVGEKLVQLLGENEIITLVADRNLSGRGIEVEMFGGARKLPAGPAFLSLATGAPVAVAAVYTTDEGWHCRIDPPIEIERTQDMRADVARLTKLLAQGFERAIAAAPTDWHMFQPAWEGDEPATRVAASHAPPAFGSPAVVPP